MAEKAPPNDKNRQGEKRKWFICSIVAFSISIAIGFLVTTVGVVFYFKCGEIVVSEIVKKTPLVKGNPTYQAFIGNSIPIRLKFYFFNLINADALPEDKARPKFNEIGPYCYNVTKQRSAFEFSSDNSELSFHERSFFHFDKKETMGKSENDTFDQLDLVNFIGSSLVPPEQVKALDLIARKTVTKTFTVGGFLWGHLDGLFALMMKSKVGKGKKQNVPTRFGILIGANGTNSSFTIDTGYKNLDHYQKLIKFNDFNGTVDNWPKPRDNVSNSTNLNEIIGTFGAAFHPNLNWNDELIYFLILLRIPLHFVYDRLSMVRAFYTYRFVMDLSRFIEITKAINDFHCQHSAEVCLPGGILNITSIARVPIFITLPHFLGVESNKVLGSVNGLAPEPDLHGTFFDVHPWTGLALRGAVRFQVNILLKPLKRDGFEKLANFTLFPLFWFDAQAEIDDEANRKLSEAIPKNYIKCWQFGVIAIAIGPVAIVISVVAFSIYFICSK